MIPFHPRELFSIFIGNGIDFILIGGLAGNLHGYPGATDDMDIVVPKNTETIQLLTNVFNEEKIQLRIPQPPFGIDFNWHEEYFRFKDFVNCLTEYGSCDIMFKADGIGTYEDILPHSEIWQVWGMEFRAASLEAIIKSKEAANRPKDQATLPGYRQLQQTKEGDIHEA